jgi:hypothetical protein
MKLSPRLLEHSSACLDIEVVQHHVGIGSTWVNLGQSLCQVAQGKFKMIDTHVLRSP